MGLSAALQLGAHDLRRHSSRDLGFAFLAALALHILTFGIYFLLVETETFQNATPARTTWQPDPVVFSPAPPSPPPSGSGTAPAAKGGGTPKAVSGPVLPSPDTSELDDGALPFGLPESGLGGDGPGLDPMPKGGGLGRGSPLDGPDNSSSDRPRVVEREVFTEFDDVVRPSYDRQGLLDRLNYPSAAREAGIEGRVALLVLVEPDGSVSEIEVKHASNPLFVGPSKSAVEATQFTPGTQGNRAVAVRQIIHIEFSLEQ